MDKNKVIEHAGVVTSITATDIHVEILNKSMCAACHAKSVCSLGDSSIKTIQVPNTLKENFQEGEQVLVVMKKTMGLRAVWLSYVIPLIILLILLLSLPHSNLNELNVGLLSVLAVAVYYLIIYLFRNRIAGEFTFTIEKNNKQTF